MKILIFIIGVCFSILCSNYLDLKTRFKELDSFNDKLMKDYHDLEEKYKKLELMYKWLMFLVMRIIVVFI